MENTSENSGTVIAQLVAPTHVTDQGALDSWIAAALPGAADLSDSVAVRTYELAAEQLLPHRAARFPGRYSVVFESPDLDSLKPLFAPGDASAAAAEGAGFVVFELFFETTTPTELPADAVAPPNDDPTPGPPGVFLAWTRPVSAEAEDDYNTWYDDWHCPETLHMASFVRGRRGRRLPDAHAAVSVPAISAPYLTVYDIENTGVVPFSRDVLVPWLSKVGVDHLGPESYDRTFTQAFVFAEIDHRP